MSREGEYLVFAMEQYRFEKGLSGAEVVELFDKYGVAKFIMDSFELFHIECEANMIAAVDDFIERNKRETEPAMKETGRDNPLTGTKSGNALAE